MIPLVNQSEQRQQCYLEEMPRGEHDDPGSPAEGVDRTRTPGLEPRFLTLEDVATYLNVSVAQVYALVRSGALPAIKIGGRGVWRVDRRQLDAYIDRLHRETEEWARAHPLNPREPA
jgi:excisionase family DNA binding protein